MTTQESIRYSVLDLVPIIAGGTAVDAFKNSLDLAQHAERWGYNRYWVAEHHNIPGVASAATSVVIGHLAGGTSRIRVGAGGIMLPNHAPLVIAEQFGTLESLYPGRIDLGIGRAPGGDQRTAKALRRKLAGDVDSFPDDLLELMGYLGHTPEAPPIRAVPGHGLKVPLYLLGSSDFSARLAAMLGLPFAFASHFAPDYINVALELYRHNFHPSEAHQRPYVMVGVNVFAADTDAQAVRLFTSVQQQFLNLVRGSPRELPPPVAQVEWSPAEEAHVQRMMRFSAVGSPDSVRQKLENILVETNADELIITGQIYDHRDRLHSFELAAEVMKDLRHHLPVKKN